MLVLEELARNVVKSWETGDLSMHVRDLSQHLEELQADRVSYAQQIVQAGRRFTTDDCEIDDAPVVSPGGEPEAGLWISAWLWLPARD